MLYLPVDVKGVLSLASKQKRKIKMGRHLKFKSGVKKTPTSSDFIPAHSTRMIAVGVEEFQFPVIYDPWRENPFLKFPGGREKKGDNGQKHTGVRELVEETGIGASLHQEDVVELAETTIHGYKVFFNLVFLPNLEGLREYGDEGEKVELADAEFLTHLEGVQIDGMRFYDKFIEAIANPYCQLAIEKYLEQVRPRGKEAA